MADVDEAAVLPAAANLVCAFGTPVLEHVPHVPPLFGCQACRDEVVRLCAEFRASVAAGKYDAEGYTPAERQMVARRKREAEAAA